MSEVPKYLRDLSDRLHRVSGPRVDGYDVDHLRAIANEFDELRAVLWDFVDVTSSIGPVEVGSAVWARVERVLGERRPDEKHGREKH